MDFETLRRIGRAARLTALGLAMAIAPSLAWADFGAPVAVSPADKSAIQNSPIVFHPSFGYLPTWQLFFEPNSRIQTRSRSTLGVFGPIQTISPAGGDATDAHVAVDADGNASYVWSFDNGVDSRIQTRTRSPAGTLGPISNLSPPGEDCFEPKVAVRPAGARQNVRQSGQADLP